MPRIALYLPDLNGGGMERVMLYLAEGLLARGYRVDLVVNRFRGAYIDSVPSAARLVALERDGKSNKLKGRALILWAAAPLPWRALPSLIVRKPDPNLRYLAALTRYLRQEHPSALIAANYPCSLTALWAKRLARVPTRVVVTAHNMLSREVIRKKRWRTLSALIGCTYSCADRIVAVSDGVAEDLSATAGLPRGAIATVYNPVVTPMLLGRAGEAAPHPWLAGDGGAPVIVAAGRLVAQKNFPLLLRAFALLYKRRPARLLILGEGRQRMELEDLVEALDLRSDVALLGFVDNPYAVYARADLFVLSSDYEGLPTVLIEALACGCPVVSTDCPSGPREILEGGRYGELVPVGDAELLADAMARALDAPLPRDMLRQRGSEFSLDRSVEHYLRLLLPEENPARAQ